jgi:hypothetical protein
MRVRKRCARTVLPAAARAAIEGIYLAPVGAAV